VAAVEQAIEQCCGHPVGVAKEGTFGDLIVVKGSPLETLDVVADLANNVAVTMTDGKMHKNTNSVNCATQLPWQEKGESK